MKITFYLTLCFLAISISAGKAQVGIKTMTPLGVFHIDSKENTSTSGGVPVNDQDDFIIKNDGTITSVGIGTAQPTASLDVIGSIRITDGTEGNNRVLACDANGIGSWTRIAYASKIDGVIENNKLKDLGRAPSGFINFAYAGAYITLPPGDWQIYFYCLYYPAANSQYTIWWDLCDTSSWTGASLKGRVLSYFVPKAAISPTYASYSVNPTTTTTYYLFGGFGYSDSSLQKVIYHSGARIWAVPAGY